MRGIAVGALVHRVELAAQPLHVGVPTGARAGRSREARTTGRDSGGRHFAACAGRRAAPRRVRGAPLPPRRSRRRAPPASRARARPAVSRRVATNSWRMSVASMPTAEAIPGLGGTSTVGMPSSRASALACSGPGAAEGDEHEVARIVAALHRDEAHRADHVGVGDLHDAAGRGERIEAEGRGHPLGNGAAGRVGVERHLAAQEERRVEAAQRQVRVGDGRRGAAQAVARRPGRAPALRGPTRSAPPRRSTPRCPRPRPPPPGRSPACAPDSRRPVLRRAGSPPARPPPSRWRAGAARPG